MSVVALTGIIRSGKSIEAVQILINNLKRMRHVYTNIDGRDDMQYLRGVVAHVCEKTNEQEWDILQRIHFLGPLDVRHFYDFVNHESAVICIDEAHDHMDSREWDDENRKSMNTWIKKSGKGGHELVLVTQDVEELDKRIRTLIAWTYVFQKVDYLGSFVVNKFSCDQFRYTNIKKKPFKSFHRSYDQKLFPCYKSFAEDHIVEVTAIKKSNIFNHWSIKVAVVAIVITGYLVFKSSLFSGDLFGAKKLMSGNEARIASLSHSGTLKNSSDVRKDIPVMIEYKDLISNRNMFSSNQKKGTVVENLEVLEKKPEIIKVCKTIADVSIGEIQTIINDCGTYIEKFKNGVLVSKREKNGENSREVELPNSNKKGISIKAPMYDIFGKVATR